MFGPSPRISWGLVADKLGLGRMGFGRGVGMDVFFPCSNCSHALATNIVGPSPYRGGRILETMFRLYLSVCLLCVCMFAGVSVLCVLFVLTCD